jgi:putative ATPase
MDLFDASLAERQEREQPLAARLRPRTLDEYVGQDHILGPGRLLRRAIQADQLSSLIFYGPPGTGKTTLASVIAHSTRSHFISINAVLAGVGDIRTAIDEAQERQRLHAQRTILFIDEVHRFNKAQQDALLPWVENGIVILIGATTENPYFSVNRPLLSRSRVFQLKSLGEDDLRRVVVHALESPNGYAHTKVNIDEEALDHLVDVANGDARALLNALELAVETTEPDTQGRIAVTLEVAEESIQQRALLYDKEGDYHFDTISAFIKSMRGSDPDATLYWLARMVYAGEDPLFIFRRMIIFASEDIGLADPNALQVALDAASAFDRVGLPEGRFPLSHAALYLATAPKSNSTMAFFDALAAVEKEHEEEVPNHLKDASRDSEGFGHGANYLYPHAFRDHWVAQQYLPSSLQGRVFYQPSDSGSERALGAEVQRKRELQLAAMMESQTAPEILSFSPPNKERDAWLERAAGQRGDHLERVRERIIEALSLERHHLVLDLNSGTGLLAWEALRRTPEGGVWMHTTDKASAIALQEVAAHLPDVERPRIVYGPLGHIGQRLDAIETNLRFDGICGRNAIGGLEDKRMVLSELASRLAPNGRLALVETLSRRAQRLHSLLSSEALPPALRQRLVDAEEAIYADRENPHVAWDEEILSSDLREAGLEAIHLHREDLLSQRPITPQQLAHWFDPGGEKRPTYSSYLSQYLDSDELRTVRQAFEREIAHKTVPWSSTQITVTARAPAQHING